MRNSPQIPGCVFFGFFLNPLLQRAHGLQTRYSCERLLNNLRLNSPLAHHHTHHR